MKKYSPIILLFLLIACESGSQQERKFHVKIDSLENQLQQAYKPGFGEFMSGIQMHHAKLWFAGKNNNWALADFEVNEIREALEDIQRYETDRPEVKSLPMILPAMDSITTAVRQHDSTLFKSSFLLLTNTCNNCHKATEHGFNVVTIPSSLPVVNQDFSVSH